MKTSTKTISYDFRAKIFIALVCASALAIAVYTYAVLATIQHAVARESLVNERSALSVMVSELEYKDIALRNRVNLDTALMRGFIEVTSPLYVSRGSDSLTLNSARSR
jgi:hypothetical protein